jgi:hypothetical protein
MLQLDELLEQASPISSLYKFVSITLRRPSYFLSFSISLGVFLNLHPIEREGGKKKI